MNTASIPIALMAAICFYVGFNYLLIYIRRREETSSLLFSLVCLSVVIFDIFSIGLLNSKSLSEGMFWQSLQITSLAIFVIAITWFVCEFTNQKSNVLPVIISVLAGCFFLLGIFIKDNELTLSLNKPFVRHLKFGNSIDITYYECEVGLIFNLQYFFMFAAMTIALFILFRHYKNIQKRPRPLMFSVGIFYIAAINDMLISTGVYTSIYLFEYAYLIIIISMDYVMFNKFVDLHIEVEEFNINLEKKVEKRSLELKAALNELSDANKKLEEKANVDGLTGIKNRRYFDERFKEEWQRAHRNHLPISVLMVDIDYFKKINDRYGHLVGDECLKSVAQTIRSTVKRSIDTVARYGGEEFSILMQATSVAEATKLADLIRTEVESNGLNIDEEIIRFTVSIGVATLVPKYTDEPEIVISRADNAMYQAKDNGRNQVVVYTNSNSVAS